MKYSCLTLLSLAAIMLTLAHAGDTSDGKALVQQHCQGCHDDAIYSRSNSIIHSWPELQARVEFCDNAAQAHMNDAQISQVIKYLNNTYYKFPQP